MRCSCTCVGGVCNTPQACAPRSVLGLRTSWHDTRTPRRAATSPRLRTCRTRSGPSRRAPACRHDDGQVAGRLRSSPPDQGLQQSRRKTQNATCLAGASPLSHAPSPSLLAWRFFAHAICWVGPPGRPRRLRSAPPPSKTPGRVRTLPPNSSTSPTLGDISCPALASSPVSSTAPNTVDFQSEAVTARSARLTLSRPRRVITEDAAGDDEANCCWLAGGKHLPGAPSRPPAARCCTKERPAATPAATIVTGGGSCSSKLPPENGRATATSPTLGPPPPPSACLSSSATIAGRPGLCEGRAA